MQWRLAMNRLLVHIYQTSLEQDPDSSDVARAALAAD